MTKKTWRRIERLATGHLALVVMMVLFVVCAALAQVPAAPPTLTEVEQLKLQMFRLTLDLETAVKESNDCRGALGTWRAEYQRGTLLGQEQQLKAEVEKGHPGYTFDTRAATFTKKPEDPPAPSK